MSLDLFKAYNRENLSYFQSVMEAINIPDVFIYLVLMLHDCAKSILLLDFISKPIDLTFSVGQGGSHCDDIVLALCGALASPHGGGDHRSVISCQAGKGCTSSSGGWGC